MAIPNLANPRRHGHEWQSRCKLARSKMTIKFGHQRPAQNGAHDRPLPMAKRAVVTRSALAAVAAIIHLSVSGRDTLRPGRNATGQVEK
jgi:hypothetical protein